MSIYHESQLRSKPASCLNASEVRTRGPGGGHCPVDLFLGQFRRKASGQWHFFLGHVPGGELGDGGVSIPPGAGS